MKVLDIDLFEFNEKYDMAAAIGYFDGVHQAHQKLLTTSVEIAAKRNLIPTVITFSPDPRSFFNPQAEDRHLTSIEDKYIKFAALKIELVLNIKFNRQLADLSTKDFMDQLARIGVKELICGYNFHFAKNQTGNCEILSQNKAFNTTVIAEFANTSSTAIRQLIETGHIKTANRLLKGEYTVKGRVVKGFGKGTKIGFPTANIDLNFPYVLPKDGVYKAKVKIADKEYISVVNIGNNPTFKRFKRTLEVHILDFSENIYDQQLELSFIDFIRKEREFKNSDELVKQLKIDIAYCKMNKYIKMIRDWGIPGISFLCALFYFIPFVIHLPGIDSNTASAVFKIMIVLLFLLFVFAMIWMAIAWIFIVVLVIWIIVDAIFKKQFDPYKLIAIISIVIFYLIILIAITHGLILTA